MLLLIKCIIVPISFLKRSNSLLSQLLLDYKTLTNFVDIFEHPAHIKEVNSGCYLFANQEQLAIYGMSSMSELTGLTFHDLREKMSVYWGASMTSRVAALEHAAVQGDGLAKQIGYVFIDACGKLRRHNITKLGMRALKQTPSLMLTLNIETQLQMSLIQVFDQYLKILMNKRSACMHMLGYLNVQHMFIQHLSVNELRCLLYMRETSVQKVVAQRLQVSLKTVESHVANIVSKSKGGNLLQVLQSIQV